MAHLLLHCQLWELPLGCGTLLGSISTTRNYHHDYDSVCRLGDDPADFAARAGTLAVAGLFAQELESHNVEVQLCWSSRVMGKDRAEVQSGNDMNRQWGASADGKELWPGLLWLW